MKHDWAAAKALFVEGEAGKPPLSLDEVAVRFGIRPGYLRDRAAREKWKDAQGEYRAKIERVRTETKTQEVGALQAEFDTKVLRVVETQLAMVVQRMNEINAAVTPRTKRKSADTRELRGLAQTLRTLQAAGRIALGVPMLPNGLPLPVGKGSGTTGSGVVRYEWVDDDPTQESFD